METGLMVICLFL